MENKFDIIKSKIKLAEYASKFVKLKPLNSNKLISLCPFHTEKTASFHISLDTDLFYCFGCGKGGDLISFYCEINKCDTKKAMEDLCALCNISIKFKVEFNNLNKLQSFFQTDVSKIEFLRNRGVKEENIKKFQLGWSNSFAKISKFLNNEKLDFQKYGFKTAFFKLFQNRITFPIFDEYGKLLSFGGRCIDDRDVKYINGAESELFHKGTVLYGLNFIKERKKIYLVEGYLDAILMQQNNYSAVASMGTAISADQINLLWKYTDHITIFLDGDNAGKIASSKVALLGLENIVAGKEMSFILLDNKEDPASYLAKNESLDSLKEYPLYEFFIVNNPIPDTPDKKAKYFKDLLLLADTIKDKFIKIEYRKKWNDLRWSRQKSLKKQSKLNKYDKNALIVLLFKYVLKNSLILDHVAEDFLKLEMNDEYKMHLISLLNNQKLKENFINEIDKNWLIDDTENFDKMLEEWYIIYNHIQNISSTEREERFLQNFSENEWNFYKEWIKKKEEIDE